MDTPKLRNVMESLVMQKLSDMLPRLDCCKCELCKLDIAAFALNHLPPRYVSSIKGELFSRYTDISSQTEIDIASIIAAGANVVREKPRHQQQA